jgi:outer membrane lipoprotein-sorting protein
LLAVCVLLLGAATQAQLMPQPFSADFTASTASHAGDIGGKMFFSLPNMRMNMSSRGQDMSMIMDGSKQTTYMLMHAQKMYMEFKPGQFNPMARNLPQVESKFDPSNPCASSLHSDATCKDLGEATWDGRSCEKWLLTQKNGHSTTMWVDQKLHFPIRSENSDGSVFAFSNIKEGAQPASLFEVPPGYRPMDINSMMGGQRPQ